MKQIAGIWLPDGDTHFAAHLESSEKIDDKGTYQLKKITKALEWVTYDRRDVALDIGAHVGLWTRLLAKEFSRVVAFDPIPDFTECLEKNCEEYQNVEVFQFGISDSELYAYIVIESENSGNSHILPEGVKDRWVPNSMMVQLRPLDSVVDYPVDFIKIDVEGCELLVLKGATRVLEESKPVIVLEQKPRNAERYGIHQLEALCYLEKRGYEKVWEIAGDHCVVHKSRL